MALVLPVRTSASRIPFKMYRQLYRGSMRGKTDELKRHLDHVHACGDEALLHGFPRDVERNALRLIRMCDDAGLSTSFSWGLDGSKDEDGTKLTAAEKGTAIGHVLAMPRVVFGARDGEGQWDSDIGPMDDMDEKGALELGDATRAVDAGVTVGDQPWPWILSHGDIRRTSKPIASGGIFRGFPVDEFAVTNTAGMFRQLYWLDWGPDAYLFVADRMDSDWAAVDRALRASGINVPMGVTLQARGHDKNPHHLAHAIIRYGYRIAMPVIFWQEFGKTDKPDAVFDAILAGLKVLDARGFLPVGCDPREAVRAWQRDHNRTAPQNRQLVVDGWFGRACLRVLGLLV